ncbi:MAG: GtrA family protein [Lachnospiraceae bacterium]|nr:GtrA family protein [Lachnospiraceae bacterium]
MKDLIKKMLNRETILYLICGVLTTLVNMVTLIILNRIGKAQDYFGMGEIAWVGIANAIAWLVSVLFAFVTNKLFVFESKSWKAPGIIYELGTFMVCRVLSGVFDEVFIIVAVGVFHLPDWLAKIIANVVVVIANYFASKLIIFRKKKTPEQKEEGAVNS